jgi:hypothetical protein
LFVCAVAGLELQAGILHSHAKSRQGRRLRGVPKLRGFAAGVLLHSAPRRSTHPRLRITKDLLGMPPARSRSMQWRRGYTERFGIVAVDFADPARPRTVKDSARWLSSHFFRMSK